MTDREAPRLANRECSGLRALITSPTFGQNATVVLQVVAFLAFAVDVAVLCKGDIGQIVRQNLYAK